MLDGEFEDESIARLLLALRAKGESTTELVGAARAMRDHMVPIRTHRIGLLDTCGTGGDGAKTFNISTAAAIVAAAAGVPVAKHGNRRITSASGSADVLAALGIRIDPPREIVERCLDELGICFCFAPALHPAMKHVAQVRRQLGVPTLFNYLGPLCNPAQASFQVLGVSQEPLQRKIAEALAQLPLERAVIVRGLDGLDEVSLSASTQVFLIQSGRIESIIWDCGSFGLEPVESSELYAEGPEQSAEVIRGILRGQPGAPQRVVLANAAAGVWLAGLEPSLLQATERCRQAIVTGAALSILERLAELSQST